MWHVINLIIKFHLNLSQTNRLSYCITIIINIKTNYGSLYYNNIIIAMPQILILLKLFYPILISGFFLLKKKQAHSMQESYV
jgi:hypothetical protein